MRWPRAETQIDELAVSARDDERRHWSWDIGRQRCDCDSLKCGRISVYARTIWSSGLAHLGSSRWRDYASDTRKSCGFPKSQSGKLDVRFHIVAHQSDVPVSGRINFLGVRFPPVSITPQILVSQGHAPVNWSQKYCGRPAILEQPTHRFDRRTLQSRPVHDAGEASVAEGWWEVQERIHRFEISSDVWRAMVRALQDKGWRLSSGGGLDHSWAVLERDGMRIDMEYDTWGEGELVIASGDAANIAADLPTTLSKELRLNWPAWPASMNVWSRFSRAVPARPQPRSTT